MASLIFLEVPIKKSTNWLIYSVQANTGRKRGDKERERKAYEEEGLTEFPSYFQISSEQCRSTYPLKHKSGREQFGKEPLPHKWHMGHQTLPHGKV